MFLGLGSIPYHVILYHLTDSNIKIRVSIWIGSPVRIFRCRWLDTPNRIFQEHRKEKRLWGYEHRCDEGQKPSSWRISILVSKETKQECLCGVFSDHQKWSPLDEEGGVYTPAWMIAEDARNKIFVPARFLNHNRFGGLDRHARKFVVIYGCFT